MTYRPYFILDSGAFSAFHSKVELSFDDYIRLCKKVQRKDPNAVYINMDVISRKEDTGHLSYANWQRMRAEGLNPIPVYHLRADVKWLHKYLRDTDHIALGIGVHLSTSKRIPLLDRLWEDHLIGPDRMPKAKVHGLAVTSFSLMQRYPWYSVDSSTWMYFAAYGKIFVPRMTHGIWDYTRQPYSIAVSVKSPEIKNKGNHIQNVSPLQRRSIDRWISELGMKLGKTKVENGEEVTVEEGLENSTTMRGQVNSIVFARFAGAFPWPRPFTHGKLEGILV